MVDMLDLLVLDYGGEAAFVSNVLRNTIFFHPSAVRARHDALVDDISNGRELCVRYSKAAHGESREPQSRTYGTTTVRLKFDTNDNAGPARAIHKATGLHVSSGSKSHLRNFVISHVWEHVDGIKPTLSADPFFFTSLWNIVLVPAQFNFLMDKPKEAHPAVASLKEEMQRICTRLYDPGRLLSAIDPSLPHAAAFPSDLRGKDHALLVANSLTPDESRQLAKAQSVIESGRLERPLKTIGKSFFIENYSSLRQARGAQGDAAESTTTTNDTQAVAPRPPVTTESVRLSRMRTIVNRHEAHAALITCVRSAGLKTKDRAKANELLTGAVATRYRVSEICAERPR